MRLVTVTTCCGERIPPPPPGGYRLTIRDGWRIDRGISRMLIAEGPMATVPLGRKLYRWLQLQARRGRP